MILNSTKFKTLEVVHKPNGRFVVYQSFLISGKESKMQNVPYVFDNECWNSLNKHTSLDDADHSDNRAAFPGKSRLLHCSH